MTNRGDDFAKTVEIWCRSILTKDTALASTLRDPRYSVVLPDGATLTREQELAFLASSEHSVKSLTVARIRAGRRSATATLETTVATVAGSGIHLGEYVTRVDFELRDGEWRAVASHVTTNDVKPRATRGKRAATWFRRRIGSLTPSFQELTYLPYRPGEDFALPRSVAPAADAELPIPPRELWLAYHYPAHGKMHVDAMLGILAASGFALQPGDRVLDFGCAAGRMIRHLQPFAATCEIWGTDISAEHILWCRRHLSPPFRFVTTTKIPHLPFEDRSFRLIYCGSVYTHIDDLADAWLLEMKRILVPGGMLYVTLHDNHTVALLEDPENKAGWLRWIREREAYRQAKESFDMISIGRGHESQIFYDRDYFVRMVSADFDVLSITPEAYFYQTAYLLRRRDASSR